MVNRPKILYLITKSVWGGAGKYGYELAAHTTEFETMVAAGGRGALAKKLSEKGIAYFEIRGLGRDIKILGDLLAFFQILAIIFKNNPDILHSSSPKAAGIGGLAFFIYKLITFRFSAKSIYTIHGWVFNEPRPKWQQWILRNFSRLICVFYNKIIVISKKDYQSGVDLYIAPKKKFVLIHNGIDPQTANFLNKEEAQKKLLGDVHPDTTIIGAIGEFTKNKGYTYLIDAAKLLQGLKFKILIIAWGEEKKNLEAKIKNYGQDREVFLIDNLSPASPYLKSFDVFVLPSLKEGLPYVLLEAGLAGLPVVATDVGGNSDIIEHERTGLLVPPANPEALARALKRFMFDVGLGQKLSHNLYQKILSDFSQKEMLEKTLALYKEIAGGTQNADS